MYVGIPAGVADSADFRTTVHRAEGVLMERHSCLPVDALLMMACSAHRNHLDIADVASVVISTLQLPLDS